MIYGMKEINSNSNKNYKLCMQLSSRKFRERYGLYMIEGNNLLAEIVKCGAEVEAIFVRDGYAADIRLERPEPYVMSKRLFDNIAQTETSQGIAAIVRKKVFSEEEFFSLCGDGNVIVLDRLQDPGNIGTVIRTAEAAGYKGAVVLKGTGDIFSPKAVRAAAGSLFRLPALFIDSPEDALKILKSNGKKTVCACQDAETAYRDVDMRSDTALFIGNEGGGLCSELIDGADVRAKIPMASGVDSLNVAVAAGIMMFERTIYE